MSLETPLQTRLQSLEEAGAKRFLHAIAAPDRPWITYAGQRVLDFCSNDYLGFSQHPALVAAAQDALATYGVGTGGARLIGGSLDLHAVLEAKVAAFKHTPAALVFNSGYQANVGVVSGLVGRHDAVFADKLNHASLVDGVVLSRAHCRRYPHADMAVLQQWLAETSKTKTKWIITDTVFSMDGDCAPLLTLFDLAEQYDAWLIIDEAHATGVFGKTYHSGLWETTGVGFSPRVIQIGTFSKALGSFGAYVAASDVVIETLIQSSRSFVYSTSLPPAVIAANLAAIDELLSGNSLSTEKLWRNIDKFQQLAKQAGLILPEINSPILPLMIGDVKQTLQAASTLLSAGFYLQAIRPPTVPKETARLRMTLSAQHELNHLEALISALQHLKGSFNFKSGA